MRCARKMEIRIPTLIKIENKIKELQVKENLKCDHQMATAAAGSYFIFPAKTN